MILKIAHFVHRSTLLQHQSQSSCNSLIYSHTKQCIHVNQYRILYKGTQHKKKKNFVNFDVSVLSLCFFCRLAFKASCFGYGLSKELSTHTSPLQRFFITFSILKPIGHNVCIEYKQYPEIEIIKNEFNHSYQLYNGLLSFVYAGFYLGIVHTLRNQHLYFVTF